LKEGRRLELHQREMQIQRKRKVAENLICRIDLHIRTRSSFDCRDPLRYKCSVSSIQQDNDVQLAVISYEEVFLHGLVLLEFILSRPDRFAVDNPNRIGVSCLTPFQGSITHRVFGYFKCLQCGRPWNSASTWQNKWQKCQSCESQCYPYKQHPLLVGDRENQESLRPHDKGRCQRCRELGKLCVPSGFYSL
jgi:hypothetical protein